MKNRTLPYGYEMQNGKIAENRTEAETVRKLFSAYASGASYRELAIRMESSGMPYSQGETRWNKNKVSRILNSEMYCGEAGYPALIDRDLYERAVARKPMYGEMTDDARRVKAIRALSRCAICGGTIRMSAGHKGWTRWNCADCGALGPNAETERVMGNLAAIYQALVRGEYEISIPEKDAPANDTLRQKENAFDELLDSENFDEAAATTAAMKLAALRYDDTGPEDYETRRIQYQIEQLRGNQETDITQIRGIVAAILIHPNGGVSIRLKNGQLLGGKS